MTCVRDLRNTPQNQLTFKGNEPTNTTGYLGSLGCSGINLVVQEQQHNRCGAKISRKGEKRQKVVRQFSDVNSRGIALYNTLQAHANLTACL